MYFRVILFLCISISVSSQTLTYRTADSITYYHFINKNYKEVIEVGNKAIEEEIEFYYLRMRLGMAYFYKNNFEKALPHFTKAYQMNPADTTCQEFLFYSHINSGREEEAKILATSFSDGMKKKLGQKKKIIENVSMSGGYGMTDNATSRQNNLIIGKENIYAQALYNGDFYFSNVVLSHSLNKRFKLFWGGAVFNTNSIGVVQVPDNLSSTENVIKKEFNNNHYQFNISGKYHYKTSWDISLGIGYFQQNISTFYGMLESPVYKFYSTHTQRQSNSFSFGVSKRIKRVQPSLNFAISNLSNQNQIQGEAGLLYYPFGNTNTYSLTSFAYINDNSTSRSVFSQKIGFKLLKWLWLEGRMSYGNHLNYISQNGFLAYDTKDPIKFIGGFDLKLYFNRLEIAPGYRCQTLEGNYIYYNSISTFKIIYYNYSSNLITTTLKWNF